MTRFTQQRFKKTLVGSALLTSIVFGLVGCGGDKETITLTPVAPTPAQEAGTAGSLVFDPLSSNVPFPNDIFFAGTTDGTLNIPIADGTAASDPKYALNELDGFSTSAPISVALSKRFETTNVAAAVKVYEVTIDAATKAVTGIVATLVPGADYAPSLSSDEKTLVVLPIKPLKPKASYMIAVTDTLTDVNGKKAVVGKTYGFLKQTTPLINGDNESITPGLPTSLATQLEPIRQLTQAQLGVAVAAGGLVRDDIVMSWSFSTQSTADVLAKVTTGVTNTSMALVDTQMTTGTLGVPNGTTKIYAGSIDVPYYQTAVPKGTTANPNAALTSKWRGQSGGILTRYSVAQGDSPKATSTQKIPVLVTVPATGSNWKVAIFQHGITANRSSLIRVADALAKAGFVGVAIDMPLHGITPDDQAAALRNANITERTFDMDLDGDGKVDSSGKYFINLPSLLTTRDNLRQAVSDLVNVKAALGNIALPSGELDVNENDVSFVGHSLGGMVGAMFVNQATDLKAAVYAMSGLQAAYLLDASPTFGPEIEKGLAAQGVKKGTADYAQFVRAAQTVVDSGDPVNYVAGNTATPALLLEVVGDGANNKPDQVIPNAVATAPLAGTEPWVRLQSMSGVTGSGAVTGGKGVVRFTAGDHTSILVPDSSAVTTQTMQEATASFLGSIGTAINVTTDSTIKQ